LDHPPGTAQAGVAGTRDGGAEAAGGGVVEVGQEVDADPAGGGGDLRAADEGHPGALDGGGGLLPPVPRVVVGERDDVEAGGGRGGHEDGRPLGAVGEARVGVEVDGGAGEHEPQGTAWAPGGGRLVRATMGT